MFTIRQTSATCMIYLLLFETQLIKDTKDFRISLKECLADLKRTVWKGNIKGTSHEKQSSFGI